MEVVVVPGDIFHSNVPFLIVKKETGLRKGTSIRQDLILHSSSPSVGSMSGEFKTATWEEGLLSVKLFTALSYLVQ